MVQTTQQATTETPVPQRKQWLVVPLVAGSVGALGWLLADPVLGIDLRTGHGAHPTSIGLAASIVVSVLAAVAGLAVRRLLRQRGNPDRTWTTIALVVLAVSLLGPVGATTAAAGVALAGLHLAVGCTIILAVRRTTPA
jgi:hypothetical protein